MRSPKRFHSFLARQLVDYLEFKRVLGFTEKVYGFHARDFDHYLVFRDIAAVNRIDEAFVYNWIHAVPERATGTKNNRLKFARTFLHYLERLGLARDNPALRIPYLDPRYSKPYIYSVKELGEMLEEARKLKRQYPRRLMGWTMETMILLIYACGLRLSEALNLRICDVDFEEAALSLWKTKFHKERIVPFSPAVGKALKVYLARREELYPNPDPEECFFRTGAGRRCSASGVTWHFSRILRRCALANPGGRRPRIHDLRHTFAVHRLYKWYQEGHHPLNKLPLLSTYMGHTSIECTQVYLTIARDLLREGDRRFQAAFEPVTHKALTRAFRNL
jgi:integrase/recombinase XerD